MRVLVGGDGRTRVLDEVDGPCVTELAISNAGSLATYADSPDDGGSNVSLLGRGRRDQILWLYDSTTGERVRELFGYRPTDLPTDDGAIVVRRHGSAPSGPRCRLFTVPVSAAEPLTCWDQR